MKILALEFSSSMRSVALATAATNAQPVPVASISEVGGRGTRAFGLVNRALKDAAWRREDVDTIAIGLGPGSYHGIRVAIAIAEGWALARKVRLIGVSSVDALATMLVMKGQCAPFTVAVDAQRGEFYRADYTAESGAARATVALRLVKAAEIEECLKTGKAVFGPDIQGRLPGIREAFPCAMAVGFLAAKMPPAMSSTPLEPIYLRETAFVKAPPPRFA